MTVKPRTPYSFLNTRYIIPSRPPDLHGGLRETGDLRVVYFSSFGRSVSPTRRVQSRDSEKTRLRSGVYRPPVHPVPRLHPEVTSGVPKGRLSWTVRDSDRFGPEARSLLLLVTRRSVDPPVGFVLFWSGRSSSDSDTVHWYLRRTHPV